MSGVFTTNNENNPNPFTGITKQDTNSTAVQVIDFAKEQISKLTDGFKGASPGQYDIEVVERITDLMKELIEASVRIEALNTLAKMNIENDDVIRDIFNDGIMRV